VLECEDLVIGGRRRLPRRGVSALRVGLRILGHRTQTGPRLLLGMTALAQVLENAAGLGLVVTCLLRRSRASVLTGRRLGGGGIGAGLGREVSVFLGVPLPFGPAAVVRDRAGVGRARIGEPFGLIVDRGQRATVVMPAGGPDPIGCGEAELDVPIAVLLLPGVPFHRPDVDIAYGHPL